MVTITFTDSYRVKRRIRSSYIAPTRGHGRGAAGGGLKNRTDDARRATERQRDRVFGKRRRGPLRAASGVPRANRTAARVQGYRRVGIGTPARTHTPKYDVRPLPLGKGFSFFALLRTARQRDRSLASPQVPSTARLTPLSQLSARCLDRPAPPRAPTPSLPRAKTRPAVAA
jgi:hypothetical protein